MRWSVGLLLFLSTPALGQSRAVAIPALPVTGFGASVALVGDELFVGRSGEALGIPIPPSQTGAIHVFRRGADGAWVEQAPLTPSDAALGDGFAVALASDGRVVVAGAVGHAGARGAAYVFERGAGAGAWRQTAKLQAADGAAGDNLGFAVAVQGDVILVGAPGHNENRGAAYAFRRGAQAGQWVQAAKLVPESSDSTARFGAALALDRDVALVGAPGPHFMPGMLTGPAALHPGAVYSFRRPVGTGAWQAQARVPASDSGARAFGAAIALAGSSAFVGAPGTQESRGTVSELTRDGETWRHRATFAPDTLPGFALFGAGVAPTATGVLVAAPLEHGTGAVWYFRRDPATERWQQRQQWRR